jgi:bile acid:Na+ symporter, BASS family
LNQQNINVQFSPESLFVLNICIAVIMFGVALSVKREHFITLKYQKKSLLTGLLSQFVMLPFITYLLILVIKPSTGLALGMLLVASCPGGNVSNFFTMLSGGNTALSISLTAFSSLSAFVLTPANFFLYAGLLPEAKDYIQELDISFVDLFINMIGILIIPLIAGMFINHYRPKFSSYIAKPMRVISIILLTGFIVVAIYNNRVAFQNFFHLVFWTVFIHNAVVLILAYSFSAGLLNNSQTNRTIAVETGIQNSGLGLVLIFTFFQGNGEMALITAWWGVWHLVAGFVFTGLMRTISFQTHKA